MTQPLSCRRTRVKLCGLTRPADARAAAALGADAIGLVFYGRSPRAVTIEQARALIEGLPPFVTKVGLFVDEDPETVRRVLSEVALDLLQFHGGESAEYCRGFARPWIKAVAMRPGLDLGQVAAAYRDAAGLLLDAFDPGLPGGTGQRFDWDRIPAVLAPRIILAGGLTPANVAEAIRRVRPYAVDVSGGIEAAKGRKDEALMAAFMQGVRDGDESR
ncbi:phosphoribosylanthranilate isomerase [Thiococcus pfennigii]|jgi:phosphoribosylanthranilate isomerase|uniref:phosphoribosylanthranilate isomerase n=1 Tax=Thiococcus pfennigii TaxID=1057 RepID=UPI001903AD94|nr:phosphoribosylanthranilate isomerase [Thiococcus pfennigii]MBK1732434.1 phosphoribosylanthranilate isomerase [Thiococcus pfennigii]